MDVYFKQKLKRNVLFWGKLSQVYTAIFIVVAYVYSFLEIAGDTMNMFAMMAVMASGITPITFVQAYFPTVISLGSGRKEAVCGIQFMYVITIVEYVLATYVAGFIFPKQAQSIASVSVQLWLMIGLTGIGQIMASICVLRKSKSRTVGLIVLGCVTFAASVGGILVAMNEMYALISNKTVFQWGLAIGAIMLYVVSLMTIVKSTKNYEAFRA